MKKHIAIVLAFVTIVVTACKKEEVVAAKGNLIGFVSLYDEDGFLEASASGATVWLDEKRSAETDDQGRFEFKDIEPGTFRLRYEKEGYSSFTRHNYLFAGGSLPSVSPEVRMIALPNVQLLDHTLTPNGDLLTVSGTITETVSYSILYFFSNEPNVSNENYRGWSAYNHCCETVQSFEHTFSLPPLGSPLYMVAYAGSPGNKLSIFNYYDMEKRTNVNPAVSKLFEPVKLR